jgi:hypothetical protein
MGIFPPYFFPTMDEIEALYSACKLPKRYSHHVAVVKNIFGEFSIGIGYKDGIQYIALHDKVEDEIKIRTMHFPIICLEDINTPREEWLECLPYDDATLNYNTDYYGEKYDEDDRQGVIQSKWLKDMFEGIAIVDPVTESLYYHNQEAINNTWQKYLMSKASELYEKAGAEKLKYYDLYSAGLLYKNYDALFFLNCMPASTGYALTSLSFIDECRYYLADKTIRIGNIFDAHI